MTEPIDLYALDLDNLHHLQRQILARLYTVNSAIYSDLKDPELTGNSFNYHLRHVVKQGLVHQSGQSYQLAPKGRLLVDSVSMPSMKLKVRPVVGVSLIVASPKSGTLLYRSNREPTRGWAGFPFGKLRLSDDYETTVRRMLVRRHLDPGQVTGTQSLGLANVRYYSNGQLVCHRSTAVWRVHYEGPAAESQTANGTGFWSHSPESEQQVLPEVIQLLDWPSQTSIVEISSELGGRNLG